MIAERGLLRNLHNDLGIAWKQPRLIVVCPGLCIGEVRPHELALCSLLENSPCCITHGLFAILILQQYLYVNGYLCGRWICRPGVLLKIENAILSAIIIHKTRIRAGIRCYRNHLPSDSDDWCRRCIDDKTVRNSILVRLNCICYLLLDTEWHRRSSGYRHRRVCWHSCERF